MPPLIIRKDTQLKVNLVPSCSSVMHKVLYTRSFREQIALFEVFFKDLYFIQWALQSKMMNERKSRERHCKRCTKFLCYVLSPKMSSHKCAQNLRLKLKVTETVILVHSLCMHPLTLLFSRSGLFVTTVKSKVYTQ